MEKIFKTNKINTYTDEKMIGKFIYLKRTNKDMDIHYIFRIEEILDIYPLKYKTNKQFYFCVPFNNDCACHCYDCCDKIELNYNDILYELSEEEWLNTFRVFVKNDNKHPNEIPSKLIQDK